MEGVLLLGRFGDYQWFDIDVLGVARFCSNFQVRREQKFLLERKQVRRIITAS